MASTYLITGASRGIGFEFVTQLVARGDSVIAAVRSPESSPGLMALQKHIRVLTLDVTSTASIEALAVALGPTPIDVLINNAGVSSTSKSVEHLDAAEMHRVFHVNAIAPMIVAKSVLKNLRIGKRKTIFNITSQLGSIANNTGGSSYAYRASKAALNQLNRSLANELAPDGFTCVAVHPGWVRTDMGGQQAPLSPEQSVAAMLKTMDALTPAKNGAFLNYDGTPLPW